MLESFEAGEFQPSPDQEAEMKRYSKMFRAARAEGSYGPVSHDVPYPWSKKNRPAESPPPLAGDGVTGDNPPQTHSETETP